MSEMGRIMVGIIVIKHKAQSTSYICSLFYFCFVVFTHQEMRLVFMIARALLLGD